MHPLLQYLKSNIGKLKQLPGKIDPDMLATYSEVPAHILANVKKLHSGTAGRQMYNQGLAGSIGGSTLSALVDHATAQPNEGTDINKTRALVSGVLGGVAGMVPGLHGLARAGVTTAKRYHTMARGLSAAGIMPMSESVLKAKSKSIKDIMQDPSSFLSGLRGNGTSRDTVRNLLKPDNAVEVAYLENVGGVLPTKHLETAAKDFGHTTLHSGRIVNPNVARHVLNRRYQEGIRDLGFTRLTGETGVPHRLGPELSNILHNRFKTVTKKLSQGELDTALNISGRNFEDLSPAELTALLPSRTAKMFPFSADIPNVGKNKFTTGRRNMSGPYEGEFNTAHGYNDLPPDTKQWLKTQGILNSRYYENMTNNSKWFMDHGKFVAHTKPQQFLDGSYTLPSLNTIFKPGVANNFDIKL